MANFGDPGGIRTPGLLIRSQTLYPAELLSHTVIVGRGSRTWTHNQRFWRPLLYQLSYTPVSQRLNQYTMYWRLCQVLFCSSTIFFFKTDDPIGLKEVNQRLPILPGRLQPSTFGVYELNYCVRDGNRWTLVAIATESVRACTLKTA